MPDRKSENMPDSMSEYLPEKMSETINIYDVCQDVYSIYIYIHICHGGGTHKVYKLIFIFARDCQPYEFLYIPAIATAMPYKPHLGFIWFYVTLQTLQWHQYALFMSALGF